MRSLSIFISRSAAVSAPIATSTWSLTRQSLYSLLESLRLEWDLNKHLIQGKSIVSVYFGGGTPFLIGPEAIAEILSWIQPPPNY